MKFRRYNKPLFEYFLILFIGFFGILMTVGSIMGIIGLLIGTIPLTLKCIGNLILLTLASTMCIFAVIVGIKDHLDYRRTIKFYKRVAIDIRNNRDMFKLKSRKYTTTSDTLYILKDDIKNNFKDMLLEVSEFPLTYDKMGLLETIKDGEFYYNIGCYEFDDYDNTFSFVGYNFIGITNDSLLK